MHMNRKKFFKLALWMFIAFAVVMVISYFFYHFVTDTGISLTWQPEPGKPFVSNMIANFGVLFLFGSVTSVFLALLCDKDEEKKDETTAA